MTFFVFCISDTYFDSLVLEGDKNVQLIGYNMIRADHSINVKRDAVLSFTKKHWVSGLSTFQVLVNALFVKYLF